MDAEKDCGSQINQATHQGPSATATDQAVEISDPIVHERKPNSFGPQLTISLLSRLEKGGSITPCYLKSEFPANRTWRQTVQRTLVREETEVQKPTPDNGT